MHPGNSSYPWFAVRIRSRHERVIASALHSKGYEVFLPLYVSRRRWADRVKELELPLFPGYLFSRFDAQRRLPILTTPGVLHVVGTNSAPLPVEEAEIAAVQSIVASGLAVEPWPYLRAGETVRIEHGSLAGVEGILVTFKRPYRVVVSVTLLQRSVAVEMNQDWMSPVERVAMRCSGAAADTSLRTALS